MKYFGKRVILFLGTPGFSSSGLLKPSSLRKLLVLPGLRLPGGSRRPTMPFGS